MNRRSRNQLYIPYKSLRDAVFDIIQPTPEEKTVRELVVANNADTAGKIDFHA